ncbi:MAG: hypothetical protein IKV62_07505 [Bacteroidales bacterium]|nr:hypothetical protein [Bacteroidales bacterium]
MCTKVLVRLICAAALLSAAACGPRGDLDHSTRKLLGELDGYVAARDVYTARKMDQMDALRKLCRTTEDPDHRYDLEMSIAEEYFAFSFDSTQAYLKHCQDLALKMKDQERYNRASIELGHLYAKAGNYLEANSLLYGQIDTSALSEALMTDYLYYLYDFSMDLAGNSGMVERLSIPPAASFRQRLLDLLPKDSDRWRTLLRDRLTEEDRLASADSVAHLLLAGTTPEEHVYAIYAFHLSDIAERDGRPTDRMAWLIRSAECDMMNAVRDYASLTMVAQNILSYDVDRSFRYLRIAQEDALAYNAKLRPWQISRFLMEVEDAYSARQSRSRLFSMVAAILLAIMVLTLSVITWFLVTRSRKLTRMRALLESNNAQLAAANAELNVLNKQISKADKVKEEYIVDFLQGLSEQVALLRSEDNRFRNLLKQGKSDQLFKELAISERSERALEEFYRKFDETFLALYPDFVEQFNALLQEDARIVPPKGRLTTELRIFALIRLGMDDSKKIATMLDYSVSTIYNHKVAIKNAALGDRSKFEEQVKMIGK